MKKTLICLLILTSFKSKNEINFWVNITYFINNTKIVSNDSINTYFNFYTNGKKINLTNQPIDLCRVDSMIFYYDNLNFKIEKEIYLKYYDSNIIEFFEGDTHNLFLHYYTNCSKCLNEFSPDSVKLLGVNIDGLYVYNKI